MALRSYLKKQPKQFGDMHERMLFLVEMISDPEVFQSTPTQVIHAIHDLRIEVEENHSRPSVGRVVRKRKNG